MRFSEPGFSFGRWETQPDRWTIIVDNRKVASYDGRKNKIVFTSMSMEWTPELLSRILGFIYSEEFQNRRK